MVIKTYIARLISVPCEFCVLSQALSLLEDKYVITRALGKYGKYSASASHIQLGLGLVGYWTQTRYIFLYSTRACVITYNIVTLVIFITVPVCIHMNAMSRFIFALRVLLESNLTEHIDVVKFTASFDKRPVNEIKKTRHFRKAIRMVP